jgi:hypothetical protein
MNQKFHKIIKRLQISYFWNKTLKKLDSICCPQRRETKTDTLKQLRPVGEGDQEQEKRIVWKELT